MNDWINSVTAYYITKNAQGDQWATRAELFAATTFYSWWVVRVPTKNDYTIVLSDEQHDNATTRYIYNNGWEYQYTVNETAMTQAQLDALNSWITSAKVTTYDNYKEFTPWGTATTGYVVTKTASGYEWAAPSGWDVMVSSQSWNILTSWMKIWAWTESDYQNLGSYDQNTVYLTI